MIYSYALHIVLLYPKYATAMENLKKSGKNDGKWQYRRACFGIIYHNLHLSFHFVNGW